MGRPEAHKNLDFRLSPKRREAHKTAVDIEVNENVKVVIAYQRLYINIPERQHFTPPPLQIKEKKRSF